MSGVECIFALAAVSTVCAAAIGYGGHQRYRYRRLKAEHYKLLRDHSQVKNAASSALRSSSVSREYGRVPPQGSGPGAYGETDLWPADSHGYHGASVAKRQQRRKSRQYAEQSLKSGGSGGGGGGSSDSCAAWEFQWAEYDNPRRGMAQTNLHTEAMVLTNVAGAGIL